LTGTPVAALILICPGIEVKTIKSNALLSDRNFSEVGAYFDIKSVAVHAKIKGCVPESNESRE
jgi:hypothetical protein